MALLGISTGSAALADGPSRTSHDDPPATVAGLSHTAAEDLVNAVQACAAESDDAARLACYDQAIKRPATGRGAAPIGRSAEQSFGLSASQVVAREHLVAAPGEMTAGVVAVGKLAGGGVTLTLANHQVWAQEDYDGAYFPIRPGDSVTVTPGVLGGFLLTASEAGHRSIRVKRLK